MLQASPSQDGIARELVLRERQIALLELERNHHRGTGLSLTLDQGLQPAGPHEDIGVQAHGQARTDFAEPHSSQLWRREEARDEDQTRDVPVEGLELSLDRLGSAGEDHNKVEGLGCVGEQMLQTRHRHREEVARRQDDGAAFDLSPCIHD